MAKSKEGYVRVLGYKLFYRSFEPESNKGVRGTLLCLHGGPGAPHDYLLPLSDLARRGYRVIMYDQLGVGRSEMPENKYIFSIEYGVEEVEGFRREMELGQNVNLFGSSYGGLLAIAYALKYQRNLRSLITAGGLASVPLTVSEMQRLKSRLPRDLVKKLTKYEDIGDYENPEYVEAAMAFYRKHICRLKEWPPELLKTLNGISKPVYSLMNGPNEFTIIGNMKYWDVTHKLPTIRVPTLVTGGRYDEVSPKVAESINRGIRGSKRVTFEKSSHTPFWEEREKYMKVVGDFLDGVNR
ncbi:MAG TPA: proline iminopeptidase-family hydrolase [Nitrososphaerales archaeon]|nr:proline iminopeptidase-family hydrolase [Nitrososphaerales archaeon]